MLTIDYKLCPEMVIKMPISDKDNLKLFVRR